MVKYQYFYQTKTNENREGWINARDRADAYTQLRKQGIRPYRVVGDDPLKWQPWALGALVAMLATGLLISLLFLGLDSAPELSGRQQLKGDRAVISVGLASSWEGTFDSALDRYLSAYAQPGWIALPPEMTDEELTGLAADLERPSTCNDGGAPEKKMLHRIVLTMRKEMQDYLAKGGTAKEYFEFLEERQDQERDFRNRAIDSVIRAPASLRDRARLNVNLRLRQMGLAEIGE